MIDDVAAARVIARLQGHFPSLANADEAADDWLRVVRQTPDAVEIAEELILGWTKDRGPRLADWRGVSLERARRRKIEEKQLTLPTGTPTNRERLKELVGKAKEQLHAKRLEEPLEVQAPVVTEVAAMPTACVHPAVEVRADGEWCGSCKTLARPGELTGEVPY